VLPAAAGLVLLSAQTLLTLSIHSMPHLAAASLLAAGAAALVGSALAGRADAKSATRISRGLMMQTLALLSALFLFAPATAWLFAAVGAAGFLLVLSGLIGALRAARAAAPASVRPEAIDPRHGAGN
jgi:predicted MFS family arabinose efflux permease